MEITHDYFLEEFHKFREIVCSTKYTPDQKFDAWGGLISVYSLCNVDTEENKEIRETAMQMLMIEFPMRMGLESTMELEKLFNEASSE